MSILFLFIIVAQMSYQGILCAYYIFNKQHIIEKFCENKDKPQLKCDGKCHLKKMVKVQTQEKESEQVPMLELTQIEPLVLFCDASSTPQTFANSPRRSFTTFLNVPSSFWYEFNYSFHFVDLAFQPPKAILA